MPELQEALKSMWSQGSQMLVYISHLEKFQNTEYWDPLLKILICHVWNAYWEIPVCKNGAWTMMAGTLGS